ncbi:MAG: hypothetical protein LBS16_01630 [Prevotellaceae bacterium]|jgi:uncharacterized protein (TIGR02145 family)|nr:hypothetical protein [Prevotellaceae bacterium]
MKRTVFYLYILVASFSGVASFSTAQVTIGGGNPPTAGTILDLNSSTKGGLLFPNIHLDNLTHIPAGKLVGMTSEQDDSPALAGTLVYNTNPALGVGIFAWDGHNWQPIGKLYFLPYTTIAAPVCTNPVPPVHFAKYNLGADPAYDTPKKQMEYLSTATYPKSGKASELQLDATVYGGLYQWGRKDTLHGVNAANFTRYNGTGASANTANGQVNTPTPADGKFYLGSSNWYNGATPAANALWGNGQLTSHDWQSTADGAVYDGTGYYQKPLKTIYDPCPNGFRVPTQDEWERIGAYNCTAKTPEGNFLIDVATEYSKSPNSTSDLIWVRVKDGKAYKGNWSANDRGGYAIYKKDVWEAAGKDNYRNGTLKLYDKDAPEPLLFLPTAGLRSGSNGAVNAGDKGRYWSNTIENTGKAHHLRFGDSSVYPGSYDARILGYSIRCVAEQ